ncbi:hypothetical protein [Saccharothrix coeruleofusca]|uniref:Helix-turn-helix protein n=1 Tax=Saccharothrix coeruleofusca TaxID=33919 RepID=A0A918EG84_9PSEU|nr:hypothetical protein [Saccharothrix coeruleofusca]GGP69891.1 hypothetical protein GCM10010185_48550 [Saccharothrix coeruleofusca]
MTADSGHAGPVDEPVGHPTGELPGTLAETLRYGPFHRALRDSIAHRGLSLARLRARLERLGVPVGQSTLSYWQRGLRHPEVPRAVPTVRALETVLELPPESLVALVEPQPRARPQHVAPPFAGSTGAWADPAPLLAEFEAVPRSARSNADLEVLAVHDTVLVGAQREQRAITTRMVVRALRAGPDRYLAVHQGDEGCLIDKALVRPAEGCRQGRVRRQSASRGLAFELLFDRKLAEGEEHVFSFTVLDDTGGPTPGHHRTFRDPCRGYLLQLAFHRRSLPARCTKQFRQEPEATPVEVGELVCGLGGVVSAYFSDVGPGLAGVTVEWT